MDDTLDDFFAKKDKTKKKSKTKSKFSPADLLPSANATSSSGIGDDVSSEVTDQMNEVKLGEDATEEVKEKKRSKKKKDKDSSNSSETRRKEDDEWNIVEEKDYSGLRIATKSIAKSGDTAGESGNDEAPQYDENGLLKPKQSEQPVWSITTPANADQDEPSSHNSPPESPKPVIQEQPNVSGGRYIPPSKRTGATSRTPDGDLVPISLKRLTKKKEAPNISSQEDFPTLGSAPPTLDYDVSTFEKVRSGASNQPNERSSNTSQHVETKNMYSLLQQKR